MKTMYPTIPTVLDDGVALPTYAHEGDAGLDLCATEDVTLLPGEYRMIGSGVSVAIPEGFVGLVVPRSGLGCKGLVMKNGVGVIDSGYRGEIGLSLFNNNPTHVYRKFMHDYRQNDEGIIRVRKGDRVAQLLIVPVAQATFVQVDTLDETERGQGGFGSTGTGARL
jgi:dUTP pyrophosphatase